MKQHLVGFAVGAAFVGGCVAAQVVPLIPPARAGSNVQRWDHYCKSDRSLTGVDAATLSQSAQSAGAEGWELVSVAVNGSTSTVYTCFKRPVG
jgi:hypothetical protein